MGWLRQAKSSKCKSPTLWVDLAFAETRSMPFVNGGRLRLFVLRARSLLIVDTDGEQDPFVRASLVVGDPPTAVSAAGVHKTEVAEDAGRRAAWNEVFDMTLPGDVVAQQPRVVLEVFDQDKRIGGLFGTVDNPIGSAHIDVAAALALAANGGGTTADGVTVEASGAAGPSSGGGAKTAALPAPGGGGGGAPSGQTRTATDGAPGGGRQESKGDSGEGVGDDAGGVPAPFQWVKLDPHEKAKAMFIKQNVRGWCVWLWLRVLCANLCIGLLRATG